MSYNNTTHHDDEEKEERTLDEEACGDQAHPSATDNCLVCYSELKRVGISPCGHNHICGQCHLRLRHLHSDKTCPICKTTNDKIIVDRPGKSWDEYPMWGDELGGEFVHKEIVGMFFAKDYYFSDVLALFGYHCAIPQCNYDGIAPEVNIYDEANKKQQLPRKKKSNNPLRALQDHLRVKHRKTLCQLCVDNKRDFVSQLPRFAPHQLKLHQEKGDGEESGFKGHPLCEFCKPKRFYDLQQLHMHLHKDHYRCHICDKQGLVDQYFRDYKSMEKHFDRHHFLCLDAQCLSARFMVYENEIDLRAHELNIHGGSSTGDTKIQLEFRVRRSGYDGSGYENQNLPNEDDFSYGLDGEAFVPEAISRESQHSLDASTSHPAHFARTEEMRAQAAAMRPNEDGGEESHEQAFPTLGEPEGGNSSGLRVGWTAGSAASRTTRNNRKDNVGQVTGEAFPSLPGKSQKKAAFATIRNPPKKKAAPSASWMSSNAMRSATSSTTPTAYAFPPLNFGAHPSSDNFPPMAGGRASFNNASPASASTARQAVPKIDSFPSLPVPTKNKSSVAAKIKGPFTKPSAASWMASNNVKSAPSTGRATDNIPSIRGTNSSSAAIPSNTTHNLQTNLRSNNFPSLGGSTSRQASAPRYAAAEALAKKYRETPLSLATGDFPPPTTAYSSSGNNTNIPNQKAANRRNAPSQFPPPSSFADSDISHGKATKEQIKAALGPANFKSLKSFTKNFASDEIEPEAYVDQAAALFDKGFNDPNFLSFVPALLASCPNESSAEQAISYIHQTRIDHSDISEWSATTPSGAPIRQNDMSATSVSRRPLSKPPTRYILPSKKKNNWGNNNTSNSDCVSKMVAARPGSVGAMGAQQAPNVGTATKFMAKEKKKQSQQLQETNNGGANKTRKKKQKDELKALAFGK